MRARSAGTTAAVSLAQRRRDPDDARFILPSGSAFVWTDFASSSASGGGFGHLGFGNEFTGFEPDQSLKEERIRSLGA